MSDPMTPEVRDWMKRTDADPPDAQRSARQVMTRLPEVRQRSRWWPFPVRYRTPTAPTTNATTEYQPRPIPATNGHTPTVIGRTQSMFSPVKAITAGAIVAALGGVMLISQPFEQQGSVPGAETESLAPTWVTGNIQPVEGTCERGKLTSDAGVSRTSYECTQTWTSSDPRLTGDTWGPWIEDTYQTDEGAISVGIEAAYLQNEGGGWACWSEYVIKGVTPTAPTFDNTLTCRGSGGNEGLTAVLVSTPTVDFAAEFAGLIFSGDLPPVPEAPVAE
jgi:hypothetical protein